MYCFTALSSVKGFLGSSAEGMLMYWKLLKPFVFEHYSFIILQWGWRALQVSMSSTARRLCKRWTTSVAGWRGGKKQAAWNRIKMHKAQIISWDKHSLHISLPWTLYDFIPGNCAQRNEAVELQATAQAPFDDLKLPHQETTWTAWEFYRVGKLLWRNCERPNGGATKVGRECRLDPIHQVEPCIAAAPRFVHALLASFWSGRCEPSRRQRRASNSAKKMSHTARICKEEWDPYRTSTSSHKLHHRPIQTSW